MCGRKTLTKGRRQIIEELLIDGWDGDDYEPSYNIAPTDVSPVMISNGGKRLVKMMRWGLIPAWAEDDKFAARMINARAETLTKKAAFRNLVENNRCIVITDGFYEWKKEGGRKQPFYIKHPDNTLMLMAGLWSAWIDPRGDLRRTYTIITTPSNEQLKPLHDRMPAILSKENSAVWLNEAWEQGRPQALLRPYDKELDVFAVSNRVNSVKQNDSSLIERI
jgi:putative SOS response-associated peptidase YedK